MQLLAIRQWQWIILSLILGATIGYLRTQAAGDLEARFGDSLNGQARFEQALLATEQGRRCFTDLSVHAWTLPNGKPVSIVTGSYFNGHPDEHAGKLEATWRPTFFVADVPYKPRIDLATLGHPDLAQRYRSIANPTVADFLSMLSESSGIQYTHAWWLEMGLGAWVLTTFLLLGVILPCAINVAVYGSLRRPPEEKGIDLSKVKNTPPTATKVTDADLAEVAALGDAMEAQLQPAATESPAAPQPAKPAPVKDLSPQKLTPAALAARAEAEFRLKQDDVYPTARPTPPTAANSARKA